MIDLRDVYIGRGVTFLRTRVTIKECPGRMCYSRSACYTAFVLVLSQKQLSGFSPSNIRERVWLDYVPTFVDSSHPGMENVKITRSKMLTT